MAVSGGVKRAMFREGQASACPDEQTLVPPVLSRITRIRFACHQPITGRSEFYLEKEVFTHWV
jgi:hypothetical protein